MKSFVTKHLLIREITINDTDFIVALREDPDVYKHFLNKRKITKDEHKNWFLNSYLNDMNRLDYIAFEIKSGDPIGIYGVKRNSSDDKNCEISYITSKKHQHCGLSSEAVVALLQNTKENWNVKLFKAIICQDNIVSINFVEKLGFIKVKQNKGFLTYEKRAKNKGNI